MLKMFSSKVFVEGAQEDASKRKAVRLLLRELRQKVRAQAAPHHSRAHPRTYSHTSFEN